jgi:hypothetical protein
MCRPLEIKDLIGGVYQAVTVAETGPTGVEADFAAQVGTYWATATRGCGRQPKDEPKMNAKFAAG